MKDGKKKAGGKPPQAPQKNPENPQGTEKYGQGALNFRVLLIIWSVVLGLLIVAFIVGHFAIGDTTGGTAAFPLVTVITAFTAFVVQSIFSFAVVSHNEIIRRESKELKKSNADINARSEAFRILQFIASHYTVVDFVDYVLLYEEFERYTEKLRKTKDFTFYLKEEGVDESDVAENFNGYRFVTIKLPMKIVEGKAVGKVKFSRFKFTKENGEHRFLPCAGANESLILFNEMDHRSEVVVNLIMKKSSEFFTPGHLNPYLKIKISLTVQSLLGVAIKGWIELYFTNPEKLEKSGANKYKILSSHFEIAGLPVLTHSLGADMKMKSD